MRIINLLFVAIFFLTACNQFEKGESSATLAAEGMVSSIAHSEEMPLPESAANQDMIREPIMPPNPSRVEEKMGKKIIQNANLNFQVENIDKSHQIIQTLLHQYQAYFASDVRSQTNYQIQQNIVIRVPSSSFDSLLNAILEQSIFTNEKNISAEDVTSQYVDIEARMKTKKELEERYRALLKQAVKVADIIEIEKNLQEVRAEIEASEGQLKLMQDQVKYSTITLSMYQKLEYKAEPSQNFFSQMKEAVVNGWRGMVSFIISLINAWPLIIVLSLAVILLFKWRKNRMLKK